jgi:predicted nucleic acid-binding protein
MKIVSDASSFIAVLLDETERNWVIKKTKSCDVVSPVILPYEIGNALIASYKRKRIDGDEIIKAYSVSKTIKVQLLEIDIINALKIAVRFNIYAYDAYYLECCIENNLPLLSLDKKMRELATILNIEVIG